MEEHTGAEPSVYFAKISLPEIDPTLPTPAKEDHWSQHLLFDTNAEVAISRDVSVDPATAKLSFPEDYEPALCMDVNADDDGTFYEADTFDVLNPEPQEANKRVWCRSSRLECR